MSNTTIANTILEQLGGAGRVMAMTGAKLFLAKDDGVSFRFPNPERARANHVEITLDPSDTYTVIFRKIAGLKVRELSSVSFVYADQLRDLFTRETGLDLHL